MTVRTQSFEDKLSKLLHNSSSWCFGWSYPLKESPKLSRCTGRWWWGIGPPGITGRREEGPNTERPRRGSGTDRRRGRRHAINMPNFEGTWKMKSSLNFEELLKALGEFWSWDLLWFKCLNKQVCCPLIYIWNTNSDNFPNKNQCERHKRCCRLYLRPTIPDLASGKMSGFVLHFGAPLNAPVKQWSARRLLLIRGPDELMSRCCVWFKDSEDGWTDGNGPECCSIRWNLERVLRPWLRAVNSHRLRPSALSPASLQHLLTTRWKIHQLQKHKRQIKDMFGWLMLAGKAKSDVPNGIKEATKWMIGRQHAWKRQHQRHDPPTYPCVCVCVFSGVNPMLRKMAVAAASKPHVEIHQNGERFHIKTSTPLRTTEIDFTIGEEFDEETVDGRKCKVIYTTMVNVIVWLLSFKPSFIFSRVWPPGRRKTRFTANRLYWAATAPWPSGAENWKEMNLNWWAAFGLSIKLKRWGGIINPCFRPTLIKSVCVCVGKQRFLLHRLKDGHGPSVLSQDSQQIPEQMSRHSAGIRLCQKQNKGLSEGRVSS